ncbi:MAG: hypothetical protein RBT60_10595 [Candidatus Krumholzibacteria bacterium]|nr:hypothetical protein [Candidatus Krumholzibacteria bacterium]
MDLRQSRFIEGAANAVPTRLVYWVAAAALHFRSADITPSRESASLPSPAVMDAVTVVMAIAVYLAAFRAPLAPRCHRPGRGALAARPAHCKPAHLLQPSAVIALRLQQPPPSDHTPSVAASVGAVVRAGRCAARRGDVA